MRIGFDVSQTGREKTGCGYFADGMIRALARVDLENEYILYPTFGDVFWDPNHSRTTIQIGDPRFRRGLKHGSLERMRRFWRNPPENLEERLGNPHIVHSNNFHCPRALKRARLVYTLYDLSFVNHPEWTTEANRTGCFTGVFSASLYADHIISISESSREHFLEIFPHYPEDRISVIYPASRYEADQAGAAERPARLSSLNSYEFWLNVGTIEPRKNQKSLLRAYARLKSHLGNPFPLVLAGGHGWLMDGFDRAIEELGLQNDVVLAGYVDDDALRWLYQNCFAMVYPSFFEGFGLPVVEAMSLGAAVIASNSTSIPEIVGDAGMLIDPFAEEAIFHTMLQLLGDRSQLRAIKRAALERSRRFSWSESASRLLREYGSLVKKPKLHGLDSASTGIPI